LCRKQLGYSLSANRDVAEKRGTLCISCAWSQATPETKAKKSAILKNTGTRRSGPSHPIFGKSGAETYRFGHSNYDEWVQKYGLEEADRRKQEVSAKIQRTWTPERRERAAVVCRNVLRDFKGPNHPMFGRPAPQGSSHGCSGHYRGHFFRSLLELSFMLQLDQIGWVWETGEQKKFALLYEWEGKVHNYFPDFCIGETRVEIKPRGLVRTHKNQAKFAAARNAWGDNFKVVTDKDLVRIKKKDLQYLCQSGEVVLLKKWLRLIG
jgi:hypothetical protein